MHGQQNIKISDENQIIANELRTLCFTWDVPLDKSVGDKEININTIYFETSWLDSSGRDAGHKVNSRHS